MRRYPLIAIWGRLPTHDAEHLESSSNAITHTTQQEKSDYTYSYHCGKLAFGLLFEFEDAMKEDDGARFTNVYKLALLFYKCCGNHKYVYVTLLYLLL